MDKEVEKIRNQNFYLLTNYSLTDNKDKGYILMKKISYEPKQTFQIIYVSIHHQNLLMDNNYVCEDYSGLRNELSIGDELTTLIGVDRIRESSDYNVFDQSRKKNRQNLLFLNLAVGQIFRGWDIGVASMKKGEKTTFYIKSDFAHGSSRAGAVFPPNKDLLFVAELVNC